MALRKPRYPVNYIGITQYCSAGHPAIDIGWHTPDPPVYAAAEGTVCAAARDVDGANYVVIRHENAVEGKLAYTLYWHLASFRVKAGQKVQQGEKIGVMGRTGNASGVHLHFEFWVAPKSYVKWALKDKSRFAADPQKYVYCYPDQKIGTTTKNVRKYTPKAKPDKAETGAAGAAAHTAGMKLTLGNVPLYASASAKTAAGRADGVYYTWDAKAVSGRMRITNRAASVGKAGEVTGWISVDHLPKKEKSTVYTVVSGDTLSAIAAKHKATLKAVLAANPQIKDPNLIHPGDKIKIPS